MNREEGPATREGPLNREGPATREGKKESVYTRNTCKKGCCSIKHSEYTHTFHTRHSTRKKAGVFVYDPKGKKLLLVQSRGKYWGPPKGTMELGESIVSCALREAYEETGLRLKISDFKQRYVVHGTATYFRVDRAEGDEAPIQGHDVNGLMWISLDCLTDGVESGSIRLTSHCRILLQRIFSLSFDNEVEVAKV